MIVSIGRSRVHWIFVANREKTNFLVVFLPANNAFLNILNVFVRQKPEFTETEVCCLPMQLKLKRFFASSRYLSLCELRTVN